MFIGFRGDDSYRGFDRGLVAIFPKRHVFDETWKPLPAAERDLPRPQHQGAGVAFTQFGRGIRSDAPFVSQQRLPLRPHRRKQA